MTAPLKPPPQIDTPVCFEFDSREQTPRVDLFPVDFETPKVSTNNLKRGFVPSWPLSPSAEGQFGTPRDNEWITSPKFRGGVDHVTGKDLGAFFVPVPL